MNLPKLLPSTINNNKFLRIKEADNFGQSYYYAERLGVDSVAFILLDSNRTEGRTFGLVKEYKPPIEQWMETAFGGSIDKEIPVDEILMEEVVEEAGYEVGAADIYNLGKVFVSTQMNQFCHLYLVDVTNKEFVGRRPENESEAMCEVVWKSPDEIINGPDWKATTILVKALDANLILTDEEIYELGITSGLV